MRQIFAWNFGVFQKKHVQISPNFQATNVMLPVVVAWFCSDGNAMRYHVLRFVDDVMFSYNGASGPESKTACVYVFTFFSSRLPFPAGFSNFAFSFQSIDTRTLFYAMCDVELWISGIDIQLDTDNVKMKQYAKYLGQRSFCFVQKLLSVVRTLTHTHTPTPTHMPDWLLCLDHSSLLKYRTPAMIAHDVSPRAQPASDFAQFPLHIRQTTLRLSDINIAHGGQRLSHYNHTRFHAVWSTLLRPWFAMAMMHCTEITLLSLCW